MKELSQFLSYNNKLDGTIPTEIGNLKQLGKQAKKHVHFIIKYFYNLSKNVCLNVIDYFYVHLNDIRGTMPGEVCDLKIAGGVTSDCLESSESAGVECDCCTICCNMKKGECENM